MVPSAPAEPEANVPTLHSPTEEDPAEPTVSSIEVKFDDSPEIQAILNETTIVHPLVDDNVSIPELTLILSACNCQKRFFGGLVDYEDENAHN